MPCEGGSSIPVVERDSYDWERLERAVASLARAYEAQRDESNVLRRRLEEQARRIRSLESEVLDANQKRQDVAKRIDELVSQLDHLDAELAALEA